MFSKQKHNLGKEIEPIMNQMKILGLKNIINSVYIILQWRSWSKKIGELGGRAIEISTEEKMIGTKWAQPQGPMKLPKDLTFVSEKSQK